MNSSVEIIEQKTDTGVSFSPLGGVLYTDFMKHARDIIKPESYMEIGCQTGASLKSVTCNTVAVDPQFKIKSNVFEGREQTHLFQMTSDHFFKRFDLFNYFPDGLDMAFLDGMHLFEFLLRDFINVEKYAHRSSTIFMHDCLPINYEMAQRELMADATDTKHHLWWAGDVWKIIPALKKYRPDLKLVCLDCPPTGLVAITNLDPDSTVLEDNYLNILDEYMDNDLKNEDVIPFLKECDIQSSKSLMKIENFFKHFY